MAKLIETAPGRFRVDGDLNLSTVASLAADGARLAAARDAADGIEVDLGGVRQASSAGVALLLEWTDQVRRRGGELRFIGWPAALLRIAEFSNVAEVLGIQAQVPPTP